MVVNFFNEYGKSTREYERVIKNVFNTIHGKKEFNIIFVTKDEIHRINKEYRNVDRVTDVISFALCDDKDIVQTNELGDIFICVDRAIEQAAEYQHSVNREIAFLSVHGYLHLCGYDHMTPEDEKKMFSLQEEILVKAGYTR